MRLPTKTRNAINKALYPLTTKYHEGIPLDSVRNCLNSIASVEILQEDGTPWSGLLCGDDAHTQFDLACDGLPVENATLVFSWYRMPSGRYEINCYVS